jgi:hypothetical protein
MVGTSHHHQQQQYLHRLQVGMGHQGVVLGAWVVGILTCPPRFSSASLEEVLQVPGVVQRCQQIRLTRQGWGVVLQGWG